MIFLKKHILKNSLCLIALYSSIFLVAQANTTQSLLNFKDIYSTLEFHPVISVLGGYDHVKAGESHSYTGTDDEKFIYHNHGHGENRYLLGTFIGGEWRLPNRDIFTQFGLEYNNFASSSIHGTNMTGIEPATSTSYHYRYHLKSQQLLVVNKWLMTTDQFFHPYALVGIGAAFNRSSDFSTKTSETGSINIAPTFNGDKKTSFSYALGLGVDVDINKVIRFGLGYQFTDLGKSNLGDGRVIFNQYQSAVPFSLSSPHAYVNEIIASMSIVL